MEKILELAEKYWGLKTLRPLQEEAIKTVLKGQDSFVSHSVGSGGSSSVLMELYSFVKLHFRQVYV